MATQKYIVNQQLIENLLSWVRSGEIAIPEIQRPFVWEPSRVRELMDSLYQGYPTGYLIAWQNPNVNLKDGSIARGKKILIDGQQRVTALKAAINGDYVVNKEYKKIRIKIAFHPIDEVFEVQNTAILKDKTWIPDISELMSGNTNQFKAVSQYLQDNPEVSSDKIAEAFDRLFSILKKQIGYIELSPELDIDTVTEIFIRINSQGVVLSQADFAMSKIAANDIYDGNNLRKAIDYFCHLAVAPEFYENIRDHDAEFAKTDYFRKMTWLKDELDDLYDPSYTDMLRVAFTSKFHRGKLSDLVSLLSGRNFESKTFEDSISESSFNLLGEGVKDFINQTNFERFLMIIKSAGFISPRMINSQNSLNFAYVLYLHLRSLNVHAAQIEKTVRRWFVYSLLTKRYSGSVESVFDRDIRRIRERGAAENLIEKESASLSEAFWSSQLIQDLDSPSSNNPALNVFFAAQVKNNDPGFLSRDITIKSLIENRGDLHHIFPKDYLKQHGYNRFEYNQVANFVLCQQEINISMRNAAPVDYFKRIHDQIITGHADLGGIVTESQLLGNLKANCLPESVFNMTQDNYVDFLAMRRKLMSDKLREYYFGL